MAWTIVDVNIDSDKTASSEAGSVTATYDFADGTPVFTHSERLDSSTRNGFVARAKSALTAYQSRKTRETNLEATILTALNS